MDASRPDPARIESAAELATSSCAAGWSWWAPGRPAFSPDGKVLAVGSADKSVRLYDLTDPAHPTLLAPPLKGPLAAASTDGTVWLWDVTRPRAPQLAATLTGPQKAVFSVAWSPDGTRLAGGSGDRTVRLWSADPDAAATTLCADTGSPLSAAEWARYVPDLPFDPPR